MAADLVFTDSPDEQLTFDLPDGNNAGMSVTLSYYNTNKIETPGTQLPNSAKLDITLASNRVNLKLFILRKGRVKVSLIQPGGRIAAELVNETMSSGRHVIPVKVTGLASGVYLVYMETGKHKILKKTVILK